MIGAGQRLFFGEIDTKGAKVRDILTNSNRNISNLSSDQRCDWARLLLSLDIRRPDTISKLKREGFVYLYNELTNDKVILQAIKQEELEYTPVEYAEKYLGSLKDRSLSLVQRLVDNPKVGKILINAHWYVMHLEGNAESLILSDRPLIRIHKYDSSGALWVLPLSPFTVFIAANHSENLRSLLKVSPRQFSKKLNISSASQADKYIFSISDHHEFWLGRYMEPEIFSEQASAQ